VDRGLRAVLIDLGSDEYALVRVMEHDAAYRWAEDLRPDVSSFNGLPRLLSFAEYTATSEPDGRGERRRTSISSPTGAPDFEYVGVPESVVVALRVMPSAESVARFADALGTPTRSWASRSTGCSIEPNGRRDLRRAR
jgi:hypothetical protein